MLKEEYDYY